MLAVGLTLPASLSLKTAWMTVSVRGQLICCYASLAQCHVHLTLYSIMPPTSCSSIAPFTHHAAL